MRAVVRIRMHGMSLVVATHIAYNLHHLPITWLSSMVLGCSFELYTCYAKKATLILLNLQAWGPPVHLLMVKGSLPSSCKGVVDV